MLADPMVSLEAEQVAEEPCYQILSNPLRSLGAGVEVSRADVQVAAGHRQGG